MFNAFQLPVGSAFTGSTTGKALTVKSSKIVAGQEPEKTNELLQYLALALEKKLSSDEAVAKFKNGEEPPGDIKTKDAAKPVKKVNEKHNDTKKLASKSTEKLTSNKRDTKDRSLTRNEKDKVNKVNVAKIKQKENTVTKKESPPKKSSQQTKTISKKNSVDKLPQNDHENVTPKNTNPIPNDTENVQSVTNTYENDQDSGVSLEKHDVTDSVVTTTPQVITNTEQGDLGNTSFTIVENDLNSSLSSQDLMEVDNDNVIENDIVNIHNNEFDLEVKHVNGDYEPSKLNTFSHTSNILHTEENKINDTNSGPQSLTKDTGKTSVHNTAAQVNKIERVESSAPVTRPKSVRPSSSRPGAPRLREKYENVLAGNDNILVGKVNIIVENTPNEEVRVILLKIISIKVQIVLQLLTSAFRFRRKMQV